MALLGGLVIFLADRTSTVIVGSTSSSAIPIETGVPQGSVLGPLLFSLYINDIPKEKTTNLSYSLLFADDLVTAFR